LHLEYQQQVYFDPNQDIQEINQSIKRQRNTILTRWMFNNKYEREFPSDDRMKGRDENGNVYPSGLELFYHEYPYYYIWNKNRKLWKRRKPPVKSSTIGRIHIAHPKQ